MSFLKGGANISKLDKAVARETRFVAIWVLIFSAVMQAVFLIIQKWDYTVLLGNLLSGAVGIFNFFLLGVTVQRALETGDVKAAKSKMKISQALRLIMLGVVARFSNSICFIRRIASTFH